MCLLGPAVRLTNSMDGLYQASGIAVHQDLVYAADRLDGVYVIEFDPLAMVEETPDPGE